MGATNDFNPFEQRGLLDDLGALFDALNALANNNDDSNDNNGADDNAGDYNNGNPVYGGPPNPDATGSNDTGLYAPEVFGCPGHKMEQTACNEELCPVFTEWSIWSDCSVTCAGGSSAEIELVCMVNQKIVIQWVQPTK